MFKHYHDCYKGQNINALKDFTIIDLFVVFAEVLTMQYAWLMFL